MPPNPDVPPPPPPPPPDLGATSSSGDLLSRLKGVERKSTFDENVFHEDGWTTVRQLGSGSHGRCYLMKRPDGSLIVHKRVPVSHMIGKHQELAEREVNILATFEHPYIIRYFRAFVRQGQLCIVMEHASGGDLAGHVRKLCDKGQRPAFTTILDWFVQLLLALEYVHGYKVRVACAAGRRRGTCTPARLASSPQSGSSILCASVSTPRPLSACRPDTSAALSSCIYMQACTCMHMAWWAALAHPQPLRPMRPWRDAGTASRRRAQERLPLERCLEWRGRQAGRLWRRARARCHRGAGED